MVDGCLDHDAVAGLGQRADDLTESGNDARKLHEPFFFGRKSVISLHKADDRPEISLRWSRIAENGGIQIFLQPFHDLGRVFKFHIGNGKGDDILGKRGILSFHRVPFVSAHAVSFYQSIKIVFHDKTVPFFPTQGLPRPSDLSTPSCTCG